MTVSTPLKTHGGKAYMSKDIVKLFPPRCRNPNNPDPADKGYIHYVETHFGGGSVLLENDPEGISEVVNDTNELLTNFWDALRIPERFSSLRRDLQTVPFSRIEFDRAMEILAEHEKESLLHRSDGCCSRDMLTVAFFVACRQSMAGRTKDFAPITRKRTRRGMNEQASAWMSAIGGLEEVSKRMRRVLVENMDAIDLIPREDNERTLFYLDPPYWPKSRVAKKVYRHEMTCFQHALLLVRLGGSAVAKAIKGLDEYGPKEDDWPAWTENAKPIRGRFVLSGYDNPVYAAAMKAAGWRKVCFSLPNNAAGGDVKRRMIESVWLNY